MKLKNIEGLVCFFFYKKYKKIYKTRDKDCLVKPIDRIRNKNK